MRALLFNQAVVKPGSELSVSMSGGGVEVRGGGRSKSGRNKSNNRSRRSTSKKSGVGNTLHAIYETWYTMCDASYCTDSVL